LSVELKEIEDRGVLEVQLTGTLVREDYKELAPTMERMVKQHLNFRLFVVMHEFHGWTGAAMWEDFKLGAKHFNDIERLAMVGETKWEKFMTAFCKPFTRAKVRYFDHTKVDEARVWLATKENL
jgi:hypothetical protein